MRGCLLPALNQVARWLPSNGISSSQLPEHLEVIGAGLEAACLDQARCYHQAMTGHAQRDRLAPTVMSKTCASGARSILRGRHRLMHIACSATAHVWLLSRTCENPLPPPVYLPPHSPKHAFVSSLSARAYRVDMFSPKLPSSFSRPSHTPVFSHSPLSLSRLPSFQATQ